MCVRPEASSFHGSVSITELPPLTLDQSSAAEQIRKRLLYRWTPPDVIRDKLPTNYSVALECWLCRDGIRRFSPADYKRQDFSGYTFCDATAFVIEASVGGRALLWADDEMQATALLSYEAARLFYLYSTHLREFLGVTRGLAARLSLGAGGRRTSDRRDVLPEEIGLNQDGTGERWTVARIKEEGRRTAEERKLVTYTEDDVVRLGLSAAAEAHPLVISDEESRYITRAALFQLPDATGIPTEFVSAVALHVSRSIERRNNISDEEFKTWIEDPNSDLIRSIQRSLRDEPTREEIRAALLELAWHSIEMLGRSVDRQMRAFRESLPHELSPEEQFLFEEVYLANPAFGGIPLLLLHDRLPFIKEVVPDYWMNSSDSRRIQVIRTMLYYYGVIIKNLRDADAEYKRSEKTTIVPVGGSAELETRILPDTTTSPMSKALHDTARDFAVLQGLVPRNSIDDWSVRIDGADDDTVQAELMHRTHGEVVTIRVPRSEFDAAARERAIEES